MTEAHIGFLYNAASVFKESEFNKTHEILKSYYLMKCKEITRGYGLPKRHFSENSRCSFCCLEWNKKSQIKVNPIKLSKRQRRRIKYNSKHKTSYNKESLLYSNEMEKICTFCSKSMKIPLRKPNNNKSNKEIEQKCDDDIIKTIIKPKIKKVKHKPDQNHQSNVYCQSKVVFDLNKQKNTLPSTIKVQPKIIKNNKKKKDKLAGLCHKAVIAATKLKQQKANENKLNLFLKPSS